MTFSIREELTTSTDPKDRPLLDLVWDYPTEGPRAEPSAEAVLREISGVGPDGRAVSGYLKLKADGSTGCGCSIYSGVYATEVHQAARRTPGSHQSWVAPQRRLADRRGGPGRRPPAAKQVVAVEPWVAEVAALTAVYLGPSSCWCWPRQCRSRAPTDSLGSAGCDRRLLALPAVAAVEITPVEQAN